MIPSSRPEAYALAREQYAAAGVDTEAALAQLGRVAFSLHCWQGDDVAGLEGHREALGGGLAVTGAYPGRARNGDELRADLDQALLLIPGRHRLNLHASYAELNGRAVERSQYSTEHFQGWIDWCADRRLGFDFNPTFFAHPLAADGLTLSHPDRQIREYWIAHARACRRIAAAAGEQLGTAAITNVWIPDGSKDTPIDRCAARERLIEALDETFRETLPTQHQFDAVESKLFGLGSESFVVGSHEFYVGYAISRQKLYCLDAGHFHPTETLADKLSALLAYLPGLLLHISRGVRWDSDHVVTLDDATRSLFEEIVRGEFLNRVHLGLDYFDASINRVAAWVIGARSALKALLLALLQPLEGLRRLEQSGDFTARLAMLEDLKMLPVGAVWDEYCRRSNVPAGGTWLDTVRAYESRVLSLRA